jgi:hypothetical protein
MYFLPLQILSLLNLRVRANYGCSTRGCTKRPGERAEEAKSKAGKYGRIEASEYKRSGKGGSYDLTESVCQ